MVRIIIVILINSRGNIINKGLLTKLPKMKYIEIPSNLDLRIKKEINEFYSSNKVEIKTINTYKKIRKELFLNGENSFSVLKILISKNSPLTLKEIINELYADSLNFSNRSIIFCSNCKTMNIKNLEYSREEYLRRIKKKLEIEDKRCTKCNRRLLSLKNIKKNSDFEDYDYSFIPDIIFKGKNQHIKKILRNLNKRNMIIITEENQYQINYMFLINLFDFGTNSKKLNSEEIYLISKIFRKFLLHNKEISNLEDFFEKIIFDISSSETLNKIISSMKESTKKDYLIKLEEFSKELYFFKNIKNKNFNYILVKYLK